MSLPVRPPTLPKELATPELTLERVEPAELVTLLRPSEALDTDVDAVSLALEAVSAAVEACLMLVRRRRNRDCRMGRSRHRGGHHREETWWRVLWDNEEGYLKLPQHP